MDLKVVTDQQQWWQRLPCLKHPLQCLYAMLYPNLPWGFGRPPSCRGRRSGSISCPPRPCKGPWSNINKVRGCHLNWGRMDNNVLWLTLPGPAISLCCRRIQLQVCFPLIDFKGVFRFVLKFKWYIAEKNLTTSQKNFGQTTLVSQYWGLSLLGGKK